MKRTYFAWLFIVVFASYLFGSFFFLRTALAVPPVLDTVAVTAAVPAKSTDADIILSSIPTTTTLLRENDLVTLTVSYQTSLSYSVPLKLEARWDKGIIESTTNEIEVFEYESGSASLADDGSVPVIDPLSGTITWDIPAVLPSATPHTVIFRLRVRSTLPTEKKLTAKVIATGVLSGTQLPENTLVFTVQKVAAPGAGPTAIPGPNPTSALGVSPESPSPLRFESLRVEELSNASATISFRTNRETVFRLSYGLSPRRLNTPLEGPASELFHRLKISDLSPLTNYYFRVVATDQEGRRVTSDIFTFRTASEKDLVLFREEDIGIFWNKYILTAEGVDRIILPRQKAVTVTIRIGQSSRVKKIRATWVNRRVLGITVNANPANIEETPLIEILPDIFSGELQAPIQLGQYNLVFAIEDIFGAHYRRISPYLFDVSPPIRVLDKMSKKPIEHADVIIMRYEEHLKTYAPLGKSFAIKSYTNNYGEFDVTLPTGTYTVEVTAPTYHRQAVKIELGVADNQYPAIELERSSSFGAIVNYYIDSTNNLSAFLGEIFDSLFSSLTAKASLLIGVYLILFTLFFLQFRPVSLPTHFSSWLGHIVLFSTLNSFVLVTGITSAFLLRYHGLGEIVSFVVPTILVFICWIRYLKKIWQAFSQSPRGRTRAASGK